MSCPYPSAWRMARLLSFLQEVTATPTHAPWLSDAFDIPFTTPRRDSIPCGDDGPVVGPAHLWLRFLPVREVLKLSALNMAWRDSMTLILTERAELLDIWEALSPEPSLTPSMVWESDTPATAEEPAESEHELDPTEAFADRLSRLDAVSLLGPGFDFADPWNGPLFHARPFALAGVRDTSAPAWLAGRCANSCSGDESDDFSDFDAEDAQLSLSAAAAACHP